MDTSGKTFEDLDRLCDEASVAFEEGRFKRARRLYLDALRTCNGLMDDDYRISIRQYLGVCCYRLESFTEAERHDRKTLDMLFKRNDDRTPKIVTLRHNLARDLSAIHDKDTTSNLDKLEEAILLHRQNLNLLRSSGNQGEDLLETEYSLAFDLAKFSKSSDHNEASKILLEEAVSLNEHVVEVREQKDPKNALTMEARHNLASVLYQQKNFSRAKELFLHNQRLLDALSSAEKIDLEVVVQSTDRHLAACCEATKDISLSIARIAAVDSTKRRKHRRSSQTSLSSIGSEVVDVAKANGGLNNEVSGKLWTLPVQNEGNNSRPKANPTGLDTSLTPFRPETPIAGEVWTGIASDGNSRVHMGNVYATNVYYYSSAPAPDQESQDRVLTKQPTLSIEAPTPEASEAQKSRSKGQVAQDRSFLHPKDATRPRRASSLRASKLSPGESTTRSRSASNPPIMSERPGSAAAKHRSASNPEVAAGPVSGGAPGEVRGRKKDHIEHQRSLPNGHSKAEDVSRSRRSRSVPSGDNGEEGSGGSTVGALRTIHRADQWFMDLREHTHALLHYNNEAQIPRRRRVRVAVIDSGLDLPAMVSMRRADIRRHRQRIVTYRNFSHESEANKWTDSDASYHGTNCASILLQVAPHAEIYVANVVKKSTGSPSPSSVSAALEWALEKEVDIISMSLGFDQMHEDISKQIDLARLKGVLVFAAASNDGPNAPDWGVFPAWLSNVFCINSADVSGAMSWFNPKYTDEKLNFMFLGEEIGILDEHGVPISGISRLTGTSFATPIAAGTAALVLDLVRMQNINKEFPKIEPCLRTYEGMSAVFKKMSSPPTALGAEFYNVRPWRLLGKKGPPLSRANEPNESKQWYTLLKVVECLAKFGDLDTGITTTC